MKPTRTGTKARRRRRSRREGMALVIVMIFGVGALMLVTTMLSLSEASMKQAGELHRQKALVGVLKSGFSAAMNEIQRNDLTPGFDPDNDGIGALVGTKVGTVYEGVAVTSPSGQLLGRYRATLYEKTVGGVDHSVVRVVAVYPSFANPQYVVAAEGEIRRMQLFGDANPLSIVHDFVSNDIFNPGNLSPQQLNIIAPDADVPAVNVTDAGVWDQLLDELGDTNRTDDDTSITNPNVVVKGADPDDAGNLLENDTGTVTNAGDGVLDASLMRSARAEFLARANAAKITHNGTVSTSQVDASGETVTLGGYGSVDGSGNPVPITDVDGDGVHDQVFFADNSVKIKGTLKGRGTLVVEHKLQVENGGNFEWQGVVIVVGEAGSDPGDMDNHSHIEMDQGGKFHIKEGFLAQIGGDVLAEIKPGAGSDRVIDGGWMLLAGDGEDVNLDFASGSGSDGFVVNGMLTTYGNETDIDLPNGFTLNLTGSMAVVGDDTRNDNDVDINIGGKINLTFNNGTFRESLKNLGDILPADDKNKPPVIGSYWENAGTTTLSAQEAQLSTGTKWGKGEL